MTESPAESAPAEEHRGGEHPDWAKAKPGEKLPQLPEPELHDPPLPAARQRRLLAADPIPPSALGSLLDGASAAVTRDEDR